MRSRAWIRLKILRPSLRTIGLWNLEIHAMRPLYQKTALRRSWIRLGLLAAYWIRLVETAPNSAVVVPAAFDRSTASATAPFAVDVR
jgi:hypothetical protein